MPGSLNNKLIKVERTIDIYLKTEDEPLQEINIDVVPFDKLKEIVTAKEDDPLLYDGYFLDKRQIDSINMFLIQNKINPDFERYDYIMVCAGIYDWDKDNN